MTDYPNDQGNPAGATPVRLVNAAGNAFYTASGGSGGGSSPFTSTGNATLTAGTSTSRVQLGSTDETTVIWNTGAVTVYVKFGSGAVTAAVTDQPIPAGQSMVFATGAFTYVAAITASSTAGLLISTGTGLPFVSGGGGGGGGGGAVTIADGADATQGALADAAITNSASSGTLMAFTKGIVARLTSLIALLPASLGAKAAASSLAITTATDDVTIPLFGAVNETAPATDTASSGLNGRGQRIAQRLTSLIALFPSSLGAKTGAGSLSVVAASDGFTVSQQSAGTSAVTSVAGNASSAQLLAANTARLGATVTNDSAALMYLKLGTAASATSYTVQVQPNGGYYEVPFKYTGRIDAIWTSATGNARITELSA